MAAKKPRKPKVVRYPRFIKRRSAEGKESRKVIAARATIREMRSQNEALRAKAKSKAKVKTKPKTKAKK